MNVTKKIIPPLVFICGAFSQNYSVGVKSLSKQSMGTDKVLKTIIHDKFSRKITDEQKVVEFNKLLKKYGKPTSNYVVVDKKNCQAKVYTPEGNVIYKCEVALGRDIGDKRSGGYRKNKSMLRAYTTPGEFTVIRSGSNNPSNIKLYGQRLMPLAGDHTAADSKYGQVLAMHRVPKTPMGKLRENVFNNGTLKDNRVSFGCINFLVKSYDRLKSLIKGAKTKVYVLPEEKGNSLHLEIQKDGTYKFYQTKYRTESMEPKIYNKPVKNFPKSGNADIVSPEGSSLQVPVIKDAKNEILKKDSVKKEVDASVKNLMESLLNPGKSDSIGTVVKIN